MAKKKVRKLNGAAGISVIGDETETDEQDLSQETNGQDHRAMATAVAPARKPKTKPDPPLNEHVGVGDIKKAAAFANSIGGLDKAIALLQILKVAKEVQ